MPASFRCRAVDCLALHLKIFCRRRPINLAFYGLGGISHGTQATMTMNVGNGGAVRRNGDIVKKFQPLIKLVRLILENFATNAVTIPWGDVATAFYSTEIRTSKFIPFCPIEFKIKIKSYLALVAQTEPFKNICKQIPEGVPSDEERSTAKLSVGERRTSRETGSSAGWFVRRLHDDRFKPRSNSRKISDGNFCAGFQTPAKCYARI